MIYQVGALCYANLASAGAATCAQFTAVQSVSAEFTSTFVSVTCESSDVLGVLRLKISALKAGSTNVTYGTLTPIYQPCEYSDVVNAGLTIFTAILVVWASCWGLYKLYQILHWSRGDT